MASYDIRADLTFARGAPQTLTGTTAVQSAWIDTQGYEGLTVLLATGTVTAAGATGFTLTLQHSDSTAAASAVAVPAAERIGANPVVTLDTQDDVIAGGVGYIGVRRYVRAEMVGTTGTNAVAWPVFVLGRASSATRPVPVTITTTAAT